MEISFEAYTKEYRDRFFQYYDELKWLYFELYTDYPDRFDELCQLMFSAYKDRSASLKMMDRQRIKNPDWYRRTQMLGMEMYTDAFAGDLKGMMEKLDYLGECKANYLHLMPLLDTPEGENDGGYAISDYRKVNPKFGTMEDLKDLAEACHSRGISISLDFVMGYTSSEHAWAKKARGGDQEYKDRYFVYDDYRVPGEFERKMPQLQPVTAPGNFTWLPDVEQFVMTMQKPYEWDLNYSNPVVFNEMVDNMLYLANEGIDILRLGSLPYLYKQIGTDCTNLPQTHNILRMMRIICDIVCPGVLLLGEVVAPPDQILPYFGTLEKPECNMLYNVTTMASTWNAVATRDTRLLRRQLDVQNKLPREYVFLNYLRCHDDIVWALDYEWLAQNGFSERSHRKYLNDFLTGQFPGSFARGELYNPDSYSGTAGLCGRMASLCGIEKAMEEGEEEALDKAVRLDLMLFAYMLTQSGIPEIYSGDEIGQTNDYSYLSDLTKKEDSRYLQRGNFDWELAEKRTEPGTVQQQLFEGIGRLEDIRCMEPVFMGSANVWTLDTWEDSVLCIVRMQKKDKLIALFNFSENDKTAWINEEDGTYTDLLSGRSMEARGVDIPGYGVYWLFRDNL